MKFRYIFTMLMIILSGLMVISVLTSRSRWQGDDFTRAAAENMNEVGMNESFPSPLSPTPFYEPLSLESIIRVASVSAQPSGRWQLVVGGDVNTGRSVNAVMTSRNQFNLMPDAIKQLFLDSKISLVNLEGTLLEKCRITNDGMHFCGNPLQANSLKDAGVEVVSLANNHSDDFGVDGLQETINHVQQAGLIGVEPMAYQVIEVMGVRVAVVGIDATVRLPEIETIKQLMNQAAAESDVVVPYFHWGWEYQIQPSEQQRSLARLAVQNGADLVLGAHPHWVQAVELIGGVPVIYSHGNLVFDQLWSEETREGVVGVYTFDSDRLIEVGFAPIYISKIYQPELAEGWRSEAILERMRLASQELRESVKLDN